MLLLTDWKKRGAAMNLKFSPEWLRLLRSCDAANDPLFELSIDEDA